jgi:hypothetical protein
MITLNASWLVLVWKLTDSSGTDSEIGFIWNSPRTTMNITIIALYSPRSEWRGNLASIVGTCLPNHCIATIEALTAKNTSHVTPSHRIHWCAACCPATSNKHSHFYCCVRFNVFTESLPSNDFTIHITLRIHVDIWIIHEHVEGVCCRSTWNWS